VQRPAPNRIKLCQKTVVPWVHSIHPPHVSHELIGRGGYGLTDGRCRMQRSESIPSSGSSVILRPQSSSIHHLLLYGDRPTIAVQNACIYPTLLMLWSRRGGRQEQPCRVGDKLSPRERVRLRTPDGSPRTHGSRPGRASSQIDSLSHRLPRYGAWRASALDS
jgi:hypothetical protein